MDRAARFPAGAGSGQTSVRSCSPIGQLASAGLGLVIERPAGPAAGDRQQAHHGAAGVADGHGEQSEEAELVAVLQELAGNHPTGGILPQEVDSLYSAITECLEFVVIQ
ncbi:unannotated protein [freshwater metagenome]|uniref:Unannotated protein n=1 Tax=freshwater metagenome TaxID=449393 RepID=A0A6J6YYJ9_9ZZZZ